MENSPFWPAWKTQGKGHGDGGAGRVVSHLMNFCTQFKIAVLNLSHQSLRQCDVIRNTFLQEPIMGSWCLALQRSTLDVLSHCESFSIVRDTSYCRTNSDVLSESQTTSFSVILQYALPNICSSSLTLIWKIPRQFTLATCRQIGHRLCLFSLMMINCIFQGFLTSIRWL